MKTVLVQQYPEIATKVLKVFDTTDKGYVKMVDAIDTADAKILSLDDGICESTPHMCEQIGILMMQGSFVPVGNLVHKVTHPSKRPDYGRMVTAAPSEVKPIVESVDPIELGDAEDEDGQLPEFTDTIVDINAEASDA
jgi:hypothetical protein